MRPPRALTPDEAAMWRKVAQTVTPLKRPAPAPPAEPIKPLVPATISIAQKAKKKPLAPVPPVAASRLVPPAPRSGADRVGLDSSWERRIDKGTLDPDFSLDLHGSSLDQAYGRLMHGMAQAKSMRARVILVVTGKARPIEAADRGSARGAIRAKIVDWLGASEHASDIAAIRAAHRRHGGNGALYVVLKRRR